MIKHNGHQVASVRYDVLFGGDVLETVEPGGNGGIVALIQKCDRNPGMSIRATTYRYPPDESGSLDEIILDERVVYPPIS